MLPRQSRISCYFSRRYRPPGYACLLTVKMVLRKNRKWMTLSTIVEWSLSGASSVLRRRRTSCVRWSSWREKWHYRHVDSYTGKHGSSTMISAEPPPCNHISVDWRKFLIPCSTTTKAREADKNEHLIWVDDDDSDDRPTSSSSSSLTLRLTDIVTSESSAW